MFGLSIRQLVNKTMLDRFSGQQVQKIPLKTGPKYIIVNGHNVYVRTYSYDYVFAIESY